MNISFNDYEYGAFLDKQLYTSMYVGNSDIPFTIYPYDVFDIFNYQNILIKLSDGYIFRFKYQKNKQRFYGYLKRDEELISGYGSDYEELFRNINDDLERINLIK